MSKLGHLYMQLWLLPLLVKTLSSNSLCTLSFFTAYSTNTVLAGF